MKHNGSISQTYRKRDRMAVLEVYRRAKAVAQYPTTTKKLFEIAANLPVSQFYISDDSALLYVRNRMFRDIKPSFMSPYKQKLFEALYDLVSTMMQDEKYASQGLASTTIIALSRPAPCIGLTPTVIFQKYLKAQQQKKHKP